MTGSYTAAHPIGQWRLWNGWKIVRDDHSQQFEAGHHDEFDTKRDIPQNAYKPSSGPAPRAPIRRLVHIVSNVLSLLRYLIPRRGRPYRTKELHQLAYLDALRGWMALIIWTGHITHKTWRWVPVFFYETPLLQFPLRGGTPCVLVFFWISGYVISYRALGFIHTKQHDKMLETIASTLFRRYFRLFLPALPFTLFVVFGTQIGLVHPDLSQRGDGADDMKAAYFKDNYYWWWVIDSVREMNPFADVRGYHNGAFGSRILPPIWSLCTEFHSTLLSSIFMIATYKIPHSKRNKLILLCVPVFFFYEANWAAMAFVGMWYADRRQNRVQEAKARNSSLDRVQHTKDEGKLSSTPELYDRSNKKEETPLAPSTVSSTLPVHNLPAGSQIRSFYTLYRQPCLIALFLYSFCILWDSDGNERNNYFPNPLLKHIEPYWWATKSQTTLHMSMGVLMMLYPLDRLPLLQKPLRTPFSQYLGELSFGIYVTHYVVKWIVWEPIFLDYFKERKLDPAVPHRMIPAWIGATIMVLWASEIFRLIDKRVVKFCWWIEEQMFE